MALTHLIDTSVVSRLGVPARARGRRAARRGRPDRRAGITDLEIGYHSGNAREWDQDTADLSVFELIETTAEPVRRARQLQHFWPRGVSAAARCLTYSSLRLLRRAT